MIEWTDLEYELKLLDPKTVNWEYWDQFSDLVIKNIARRYNLISDSRIFNIVYNWPLPLSRKQRYLIIFTASEQEKQFYQ